MSLPGVESKDLHVEKFALLGPRPRALLHERLEVYLPGPGVPFAQRQAVDGVREASGFCCVEVVIPFFGVLRDPPRDGSCEQQIDDDVLVPVVYKLLITLACLNLCDEVQVR